MHLYPEVLDKFINSFLKLPDDKYQIKTQLKKGLDGERDCIIDFVLEGEKHVCFTENKIESKEGFDQLERYGKVLNLHYPDHEKYLFYCTKYSEPKNENGELGDGYQFGQFKWYEIAKFLKQFKENELIKNYIEFLKTNNMEQDNTFKVHNLLALENLNKSLDIVKFHIDNVREEFNKRFHYEEYNKNFDWDQIRDHKRICRRGLNILSGSGYSEVLYSIEFETLRLNVQLHVNSSHEKFKEFNEINLTNTSLNKEKWEWGTLECTSIYKMKPLGEFLNDENSDTSIKEWFIKSFDELLELMKSNPQLEWNIK